MHVLHPYNAHTRIRLVKLQQLKTLGIGLNLDSQRGTLRLTITLAFRMMLKTTAQQVG